MSALGTVPLVEPLVTRDASGSTYFLRLPTRDHARAEPSRERPH
jgi:hypothetical protein